MRIPQRIGCGRPHVEVGELPADAGELGGFGHGRGGGDDDGVEARGERERRGPRVERPEDAGRLPGAEVLLEQGEATVDGGALEPAFLTRSMSARTSAGCSPTSATFDST